MACIGVAYIVMACIATAYIVMAYIVMAVSSGAALYLDFESDSSVQATGPRRLYSYSLYSYGLYSHGLYRYGL